MTNQKPIIFVKKKQLLLIRSKSSQNQLKKTINIATVTFEKTTINQQYRDTKKGQ